MIFVGERLPRLYREGRFPMKNIRNYKAEKYCSAAYTEAEWI